MADQICQWGRLSAQGPCGKPAVGLSRPRKAPVTHPGMPVCKEHARGQVFGWTEYFDATPEEEDNRGN